MKINTIQNLFIVLIIPFLTIATNLSASQDYSGPPLRVIIENIYTTDETVVLEIIESLKISEDHLFETWKFVAVVIASYKGELVVGEQIEYFRTLEQGFDTLHMDIGSRHFVSFTREGSRLSIPDVGYHFPFSEALEKQLTSFSDFWCTTMCTRI